MEGFNMNPLKSIAVFALIIPTIAQAQFFEGLYGSIQLGVIQSQEKLNHDLITNAPTAAGPILNLSINTAQGAKLTDTSILGGLSVGYAFLVNPCFSLGLEGRATFHDLEMDHHQNMNVSLINANADFHAQFKHDQAYAMLAKAGWLMCPPTQLYGLIGPQWGVFRFNSSFVGDIDPLNTQLPNIHSSVSGNRSQTKCGYLLGLGMEHMLTCHSAFGIEYLYSHYGTLSAPADVGVTFTNQLGTVNAAYHTAAKMMSNAFMLKYSYYLG